MKQLITCQVCGKKINCSESGYKTRLSKYTNEEDMKSNFKCRACKKIEKLKQK